MAGLNLGLLHIETGANEVGDPENAYSVARVAKELPNRSRVGGLFVNAEGTTPAITTAPTPSTAASASATS